MKRHYEIMRAMRTKVLDSRELGSGVESFGNVNDVIRWRMNDLTSASPSFPKWLYRLPARRTQTSFSI
jgi:hypothetical protein